MVAVLMGVWLSAPGEASALVVGIEPPRPLVSLPAPEIDLPYFEAYWLEFLPDGRRLVVRMNGPHRGGHIQDALVRVLDTTTGKVVVEAVLEGCGWGFSGSMVKGRVAVSPKGDWIAYCRGKILQALVVPPHELAVPAGWTIDTTLSQRGGSAPIWAGPAGDLYAADEVHGRYRLVKLLLDRAADGKIPTKDVLQDGSLDLMISALALNPGTGRFAAALGDGLGQKYHIDYWTLGEKPAKTRIAMPFQVTSLALSPDGATVVAGLDDGSLAWHRPGSDKAVSRIPPLGFFAVRSLAYHPSGRYLACGSTDRKGAPNLFVVDLETGDVVARVAADPRSVSAVCFSPTGDRLATFGGTGEIKIWDTEGLLKAGK